ncbi:c-type cytochrome biogenesis protein CcmI [Breoghania sp.]|uniref:c-type cytochrome biogenesis protein CcmI n=1 Tax=Breoghania sp. TaxID=2065378 RepID=UPI0029CA8E10|nr:c-type cytochrome biogenesis protein CcmI [Breoghania sp.]
MMIWFLFAVLTAAAALAILAPLARNAAPAETGEAEQVSGPDVAIYKDQLAEIDRDLENGVIAADEAESARTEISRRLIRAARSDKEAAAASKTAKSSRTGAAAIATIIVIPLVALGLYLPLGSPDMPDYPLSARSIPQGEGFQQFQAMVAKVEERLAAAPEDGQGWDVIAPAYMRLGRADDAARAYANAIRILGADAPRLANRGEALVAANNGTVTEEARDSFDRALSMEPGMIKPRFYLALGLTQEGRKEEAISAWRALLADANGNEGWVPVAQSELRDLGVETKMPPMAAAGGTAPARGPSAADVQAAGEMSAQDRQAMIRGMVSQLDERLTENGGSADEWARLVRAFVVLGSREEALAALKRGRANLKDDVQGLTTLDAVASQLGLDT